jgi:hypothetical protein
MTASEIDFPQDAVIVNFHYEIVKAISKMRRRRRRTIIREFDIIRERSSIVANYHSIWPKRNQCQLTP